ncbi:hypothetical protein AB1Y20_000461 [Prymnesium parvum]|uniref:Uncharacterized protein n=1 Tax=Prymnesium parvum TaxID=97485 RepID=A0AB34K5E5_PRYPA
MLSPASWNSSAPMPPVWVAHVRRSTDSIGWAGLPHDPQYRCIHPPPFGQQCTLLRRDALLSCLIMPGCVALTCPDPSESHIGRKPGITGPICQARREAVAREYNHGMCKPSGCINIAFRSPANRSVHNYTTLVLQRVPSRAWTHVGVVRFRAASGLKEALTHLLPEIAAVHPMGAKAPRAASDAHSWELESTIAQGPRQSLVVALDLRAMAIEHPFKSFPRRQRHRRQLAHDGLRHR